MLTAIRRLFGLCLVVAATAVAQTGDSPQQIFDRAVTDFRNSRIRESVAGFDKVAKLVPAYELAGRLEGLLMDIVERTRPSPDEKKR